MLIILNAQHTAAGMPDVVATTEQDPTHGEGPELLGFNAEQWVYTGLLIFILLAIFVGKAPKRIAEILDARIAETKRQLDEAKAVRAEAEQLLADATKRQAESAEHASRIVAHAETEAQGIVADAEKHAKDLVERRGRMAEDKIAAEERAAVEQVRAAAADAAAAAAARLIQERHDQASDARLIRDAISGLGAR
jgi:F-type H+-transporting ATPase subunit b